MPSARLRIPRRRTRSPSPRYRRSSFLWLGRTLSSDKQVAQPAGSRSDGAHPPAPATATSSLYRPAASIDTGPPDGSPRPQYTPDAPSARDAHGNEDGLLLRAGRHQFTDERSFSTALSRKSTASRFSRAVSDLSESWGFPDAGPI
jgi:hypothetical protein